MGGVARRTPQDPVRVEEFARAARVLAAVARAAGITVPAFRSPPRLPDVDRTLRRHPGGVVVSVRLRSRPLDAVLADMVDGVVAGSGLGGEVAVRVRTACWDAVQRAFAPAGASEPPVGVASDRARVVERQTRAA